MRRDGEGGGSCGRADVVVVFVVIVLKVGILQGAGVVARPRKVAWNCVDAEGRSRSMRFALGLEANRPFSHGFLVEKLDCKVLNAWIAFPPNLHAVGSRFGQRHNVSNVVHEDASLKLQLGILVPRLGQLRFGLVLLLLAFVGVDLFATQQDALKEIDLILAILLALWKFDV